MRILAGMSAVAAAFVVAACSLANSPAEPILGSGAGASRAFGTPNCAAPATLCGKACVDFDTNDLHCGQCDNPCKAGDACVKGKCLLSCTGGSVACGAACVDVKNDPKNCGDCNKSCPPAGPGQVALCAGGSCQLACNDSMRDCDNNPATGCEVDVSKDLNNCGFCGAKCPMMASHAKPACMNGCQPNCDPGYSDCDNDLGTNGCEALTASDPKNCGQCGKACDANKNEACLSGACMPQQHNWTILDKKDIVYANIPFLLLKLKFNSSQSFSQNWCQDYTNLCTQFGFKPTGCDGPMYGGPILACTTSYQSNGAGNPLSCNPSGGVVNAAKQNGYPDATNVNSFAFFQCIDNNPSYCSKTMCSGVQCNGALGYTDFTQPFFYTLCRKP